MSKIFDLNQQLVELNNQAYFLDPSDEDDALELEEINKSLHALAMQAENIADWLGKMIHEAKFAEAQADDLVKKFSKKKKQATSRLEFFKGMALDFMITHGIKESSGTMFKISHALTPGALVFDENFNPDSLPKGFTETIPAVAAYEKPITAKITAALRETIKDDKDKLDQTTAIVELVEMPGVRLVRSESLKVK
jgi:hypothetical protein